MNKPVYIINGPMGVGKTTVGKALADALPGTAFIDGDWCLDIHPFIGNAETKAMAVDNILHMTANYRACSVCNAVVLVWLMDDQWVLDRIAEGIAALDMRMITVTLTCSPETLAVRWKNDKLCEWRTDEWLNVSLKSLPRFAAYENCIDTTDMDIADVVEAILKQ